MFGISSSQEREILRALGKVGVLRYGDADRHFGSQSVERLKDGKFIKQEKHVVNGKLETVLVVAKKGRDYARRYLVHGSMYKRSGYQVGHDIKLSERYLELEKKERLTWLNDHEVKAYFREKGLEGEAIDGAYFGDNGELVGVEVFTKSYSSETIKAKLETLKSCCGRMDILHA